MLESWKKIIPEHQHIIEYVDQEITVYKNALEIYPPKDKIFNCFNFFELNDTKVVIIGQDPYINKNQAMGLCFSVPNDTKVPPSLRNIYKEIKADIGIDKTGGDLTSWAEQGVLLLNRSLTVLESKSNSHKKMWRPFTNKLIENLSNETEGLIFILWGRDAQSLTKYIDEEKHHVLKSGHPSPLSFRYFTGCKHFSKCNEILETNNKTPINW
jgi:uracil-DNA glycosylase